MAMTSTQHATDAAQCVGAIERAISELQAAREREKGGA
jgi:hypothetical protein